MIYKKDDATSLRAIADASVPTWRELDTAAKAKRAAQRACPTTWRHSAPVYGPNDFTSAQLDVEALSAEAEAERARVTAVLALDAAELAESDEVSIARNPKTLHADLAALDAEEAGLREKLAAVTRRRDERVTAAARADALHAQARTAAGLPRSTPLPRFVPILAFNEKPYVEVIGARAEVGEPAADFRLRIENAQREATRIAGLLEEATREREARERDSAELKRRKEAEIAAAQRRAHAADKERAAERRAEEERKNELAASWARRGGASQ